MPTAVAARTEPVWSLPMAAWYRPALTGYRLKDNRVSEVTAPGVLVRTYLGILALRSTPSFHVSLQDRQPPAMERLL